MSLTWMFALTAVTLVLARPWLGARGMPQSRGAQGLLAAGAAFTLDSYSAQRWTGVGLVAAGAAMMRLA
jgi:hypothetical protein